MASSYKRHFEEYVGMDNMVSIHRADAPTLVGQVKEVDDDGCTLLCAWEKGKEAREQVFVAFEDIRGVGRRVSEPE